MDDTSSGFWYENNQFSYQKEWNDQGEAGKTYHTLRIISGNENILLGRAFDGADPVLLNVDSNGKLQFREAQANNPHDPGVPYISIDTAGELALIGRDAETRAGTYEQKRDLDLLGVPPAGSGIMAPRPHNWAPIGGMNTTLDPPAAKFTGIFDGGGREIRNLYINRTTGNRYQIGLFGYIDGAKLRNIILQSGSVQGYGRVGGIAGNAVNGSEISDCSNAASVTAASTNAGGIVGGNTSNSLTLTGCSNSGEVSGTSQVGGVVGYLYSGGITGCSNTGRITGSGSNIGGVAGSSSGDNISACFNTGAVTATGTDSRQIGGVAGVSGGDNTACFNTGAVTAMGTSSYFIGGVAGEAKNVTACFNSGAITSRGTSETIDFYSGGPIGSVYTGGVAGKAYGNVTACYNTGTVTGFSTGYAYVGGVLGEFYGVRDAQGHTLNTITACFNTGSVVQGSGSGHRYGSIMGIFRVTNGAIPNPGTGYWLSGTAEYGCYALDATINVSLTTFASTGGFPDVSGDTGWEASVDGTNGYWKPGTTGGGQLPRLWYEP
jgi:hypothetical protein